VRDDGSHDTSRVFTVEGRLASGQGLPPRPVPAERFDGLTWLSGAYGPEPTALPHQHAYLPYVIRLLSGPVPERTVYTHAGWRMIGGRWYYLHAHNIITEGET
jgi:hypothetical protein